jgi:hypothetical protein
MIFETDANLRYTSVLRRARFKLLENLNLSEKQAFKTIKEIRRFCKEDPELSECIKYLMTIPRIGWILANPLLVRIGNWTERAR